MKPLAYFAAFYVGFLFSIPTAFAQNYDFECLNNPLCDQECGGENYCCGICGAALPPVKITALPPDSEIVINPTSGGQLLLNPHKIPPTSFNACYSCPNCDPVNGNWDCHYSAPCFGEPTAQIWGGWQYRKCSSTGGVPSDDDQDKGHFVCDPSANPLDRDPENLCMEVTPTGLGCRVLSGSTSCGVMCPECISSYSFTFCLIDYAIESIEYKPACDSAGDEWLEGVSSGCGCITQRVVIKPIPDDTICSLPLSLQVLKNNLCAEPDEDAAGLSYNSEGKPRYVFERCLNAGTSFIATFRIAYDDHTYYDIGSVPFVKLQNSFGCEPICTGAIQQPPCADPIYICVGSSGPINWQAFGCDANYDLDGTGNVAISGSQNEPGSHDITGEQYGPGAITGRVDYSYTDPSGIAYHFECEQTKAVIGYGVSMTVGGAAASPCTDATICLNNNDDDDNGAPDLVQTAAQDTGFVDPDLMEVRIKAGHNPELDPYVQLDVPAGVRVWTSNTKSQELTNLVLPLADGKIDATIYLEGVSPGDGQMVATLEPPIPDGATSICNSYPGNQPNQCQSNLHVIGVTSIDFNPPVLPKSCFQTANVIASAGRPVEYLLRDEDHGSRIDSNTGEINSGTEGGLLRVRVQLTGDPNCWAEARLLQECASCKLPEFGEASASNESIDARFGLGRLSTGRSAGAILLYAKASYQGLTSPAALYYSAVQQPEIDVVRDNAQNNILRQVHVPEGLADIVADGSGGTVIKFYKPADVGEKDANGLYPILTPPEEHPPISTWNIFNPISQNSDIVSIQRSAGSSIAKSFTFEFSRPDGGRQWVLSSGDGTTVGRVETDTITADGVHRTHIIEEDGGQVSKFTETRATDLQWGTAVLQRVVDPDGAALSSSFSYYDNGPNTSGRLKTAQYSDGSWQVITYDAKGRPLTISSPWLDSAFSIPVDASSCRQVEMQYASDDEPRPISSLEKIQNTIVSRSTYEHGIDTTGWSGRLETAHLHVDPASTSGLQISSTTAYSPVDPDRMVRHVGPDNHTILIQPEADPVTGTFTFDPGNPAAASFTPGGGKFQQFISTLDGAESFPLKATKQVIVLSDTGKPVLEETYVRTEGDYDRVAWTVREYDNHNRLKDIYHSDGTHESLTPSDCCGQISNSTDATGVITTYSYDAIGRNRTATRVGNGGNTPDLITSTDFEFDAENAAWHVTKSTLSCSGAGCGLTPLVSTESRDQSGRVRKRQSPDGLVTRYDYRSDGRAITATYPGGAVATTEYYVDGRIKRVWGTAVVSRFYEYGVDSSQHTTWSKVYIGSLDNSSPRWVKVDTDALGRTKSESRSGFNGGTVTTTYSYDDTGSGSTGGTGRLVSIQRSDQTGVIRFEYDELGNLIRSGIDVDGSGHLEVAGADRIAESLSQFYNDGTSWWSQSQTNSYPDSSGTPVTQSIRRTRLTGFSGNRVAETREIDTLGNTTTSTVDIDTSLKQVTQTTNYPWDVNNPPGPHSTAISTWGLTRSTTNRANQTTQFGYDGFGRQTTITNALNQVTTTQYNNVGRVSGVLDPNNDLTIYSYDVTTGRLQWVKNTAIVNNQPVDRYTRYAYTQRGELQATWGDVPQPAWLQYDDLGQRTKLSTFRDASIDFTSETWPTGADPNATSVADITSWTYDPATGLMTDKTYGAGEALAATVHYDYLTSGKLHLRTWARQLDATYGYDPVTGELASINYGDGTTPNVGFTYDRLGRRKTVTDYLGTRTFDYDNAGQWTKETFGTGLFNGKIIKLISDNTIAFAPPQGQENGSVMHFARLTEIDVGTSTSPFADYKANYGYDQTSARVTTATGPGLPSSGAFYFYKSNSDLIQRIDYKQGSTVVGSANRTYDSRNLLTSVENKWPNTTTVSKYEYATDNLGLRRSVVQTGTAFSGGSGNHFDTWDYDPRSELTESTRYTGTNVGSPDPSLKQPALGRAFSYDPIGNRISSTLGTTSTSTYHTNSLNQYETVGISSPNAGQGFLHDADGNLTETYVAGDIDGNGTVDLNDLALLTGNFAKTCSDTGTLTPTQFARADINGDCLLDLSDESLLLAYFGVTGSASFRMQYSWDAENRLTDVIPLAPTTSSTKVQYRYDYLGRRVQKKTWTWSGSTWVAGSAGTERRWIYNGWRPLLELNGINTVVRKMTWGLDLSGTPEGAGGIGGLLGTLDALTSKKYVAFYDGNGNVTQLMDPNNASTPLQAAYEYDAYGNILSATGAYAATNPFRFSTKMFDAETGLSYYGYRYYSPQWGRWLQRDPLEEVAGNNIYSFLSNAPPASIDPLGLQQPPDPFSCGLFGVSAQQWRDARGAAGAAAFACQCGAIPAAQAPALAESVYWESQRCSLRDLRDAFANVAHQGSRLVQLGAGGLQCAGGGLLIATGVGAPAGVLLCASGIDDVQAAIRDNPSIKWQFGAECGKKIGSLIGCPRIGEWVGGTAFELAAGGVSTCKSIQTINLRTIPLSISETFIADCSGTCNAHAPVTGSMWYEKFSAESGRANVSWARLPEYTNGKTSGILATCAGDIDLLSGMQGPASAFGPGMIPGRNGTIMWHVETHAAAAMRQLNLNEATLYLNQVPCGPAQGWSGGCEFMLDRMLPGGSRLRVVGPCGYDATFGD